MGLFDRFRNPKVPALDPETEAEIREQVTSMIGTGFYTHEDVRESVADNFEDADPNACAAIIDNLWAARLAEQQTWQGISSYDRLLAAFESLNSNGIIARMNFADCQNCGHDKIVFERVPGADGKPHERGYTFFHQQDSERLAAGDDLYLAFDAFLDQVISPEEFAKTESGDKDAKRAAAPLWQAAQLEIGRKVAAALRAQGLEVTWPETTDARIQVAVSPWRKPLPA
jgi:hypothetical protein